MYWMDLTYPEIEERLKQDPLVILPVGSTEEHGHHLPLSSDSLQAIYVAEKIAEKSNGLILPPIYYGYTELDDFKGTISISFETLYNLVYDILKEITEDGVKKILIISGHASSLHMGAIRYAARKILEKKDVKIMVLSDYDIAYELRAKLVPENDSHAGIIETSRMLHIREDLVKKNWVFEKKPDKKYMVTRKYREIYTYGTLSDPNGASKELGEKIDEYVIEKLWSIVKDNFSL